MEISVLCINVMQWIEDSGCRRGFVSENQHKWGSGCGSGGRAVASDTRGLQFKSSHWQNLIQNVYFLLTVEKTKRKKKRLAMAHIEPTLDCKDLKVSLSYPFEDKNQNFFVANSMET